MGVGSAMVLAACVAAGAAAHLDSAAFTLGNGLRVRLKEDPRCEDVVVILGAAAGILEEPAGRP